MSSELPETLARLFDLLPQDGGDAHIPHLYAAMFPGQKTRHPQQALGPYITRLNRRLREKRKKIVPGVARRSYRIVAL